ncbi:hypothetical protein LY90DRAFT_519540 [Neocallimastix californiae]|uniref:Uncharacterized protein n=1 Tax=Neocallimastix californiae TaxID=1754190 RepID=A0A1Y1YZH4_9FUNG|nr:hypothetical protein LY90DRAFT_519540 [Neocallimastix californiae]|eukprot:ORY03453.1 hypothetical protein LY90DRAFT_519540 [Neocallimastix californiae]
MDSCIPSPILDKNIEETDLYNKLKKGMNMINNKFLIMAPPSPAPSSPSSNEVSDLSDGGNSGNEGTTHGFDLLTPAVSPNSSHTAVSTAISSSIKEEVSSSEIKKDTPVIKILSLNANHNNTTTTTMTTIRILLPQHQII